MIFIITIIIIIIIIHLFISISFKNNLSLIVHTFYRLLLFIIFLHFKLFLNRCNMFMKLAVENDLHEIETSWPFIPDFYQKCISKKFLNSHCV